MLTYEEALRLVLEHCRPLPPVALPLDDALGLVLAEAVMSRWDLPAVDNSAMDGFALQFAGQTVGTDVPVIGFVPAGDSWTGSIPGGAAVRIMTGAPLPRGCDTVVPLEETEVVGDGVRLVRAPRAGQHVRWQGEEITAGMLLLEQGTPLHSGELGLLAAAGVTQVRVHPRPRVALLATGDELVELGETPGPGAIVNSNRHLLGARLREAGCTVNFLGIARDHGDQLAAKLQQGREADVLLTTGGVSVGDRDLVQETLTDQGFVRVFWKVAIKPGKPVLFGMWQGRPVFGLPGNPAASAATFELFVRPCLRRLAGFRDARPPRLRVTLGAAVAGGEKRQQFLWGALREEGGAYVFLPTGRQGSGQNRSLQGAQALLPVAAGSGDLTAGTEVEVWLLHMPPGPW